MAQFKDFAVYYKEDENGNGTIEGYASTWDRVPDAYGDIVKKGAFVKCLERLEAEGKTIPFVWSHKLDEINAYLGSCKAHEDDKGLFFTATLDDTPEAQRVRQLFKDGRLSKFSFAYNVIDEGQVTLEDGTKANELRELDIFEITACLIPANSFAEVTAVKCSDCVEVHLDEKSGKRNSKSDEDVLRQAISLLQSLLDEATDDSSEDVTPAENSKEANADQKAEEQPDAVNGEKADDEQKNKILDFLRNL